MKKTILIIIIALIIAVGILCAIVFIPFNGNNTDSAEKTTDISADSSQSIIDLKNADAIKAYLGNDEEQYCEYNNVITVYSAKVFGDISTVEFTTQDDSVTAVQISLLIYGEPDEITYDEENAESIIDEDSGADDNTPYVFSDEEKSRIEAAMYNKKLAFEEYLGCGVIENYDMVPTRSDVNLTETSVDNADELFYSGDIVREYSVKDKDGNLWFLRFSIYDCYVSANILKLTDLSGYSGFIPSVDMTK